MQGLLWLWQGTRGLTRFIDWVGEILRGLQRFAQFCGRGWEILRVGDRLRGIIGSYGTRNVIEVIE